MLRNLVKLAIVLLLGHAAYRAAPVFMHHYQFRDAVRETALFSRDRSDAEILERLVDLASRHDIPLDPQAVQITRDRSRIQIDAAYVERIEWLPSYTRPWAFTISAEGWGTPPAGIR